MSKESSYGITNGYLTIIDETLGIYFQDSSPLPSSPEKRLRKDGTLYWEGYYVNGVLHGPSTHYFSNGILSSSAWYVMGSKEGVALFYQEDGALAHTARYLHNRLQGVQEYYYPGGSLQGHLRARLSYQAGLLDGACHLYYPNGQVKREIFLKAGKRHGRDSFWEESGDVRFIYEYEMGTCVKTIIQDPHEQRFSSYTQLH